MGRSLAFSRHLQSRGRGVQFGLDAGLEYAARTKFEDENEVEGKTRG
jgi:hypothetical protein